MSETININLRLPPELHAALKRRAQIESRSLNSQIIVMLTTGITSGPGGT